MYLKLEERYLERSVCFHVSQRAGRENASSKQSGEPEAGVSRCLGAYDVGITRSRVRAGVQSIAAHRASAYVPTWRDSLAHTSTLAILSPAISVAAEFVRENARPDATSRDDVLPLSSRSLRFKRIETTRYRRIPKGPRRARRVCLVAARKNSSLRLSAIE